MVRLFGLLGMLGVMFFGVSLLPETEAQRAGLTRATAPSAASSAVVDAAEAEIPAAPLGHLPEAVRRLATAPAAPTLRPVVFGEATPIPVALPASAETAHTLTLRDPQSPYRSVKAQRANVRSGPSTDYEVLGQLSRGEEVEVLDQEGAWLLVRMEGDGFEGWVSSSLFAD